jgi:hypothetical protein
MAKKRIRAPILKVPKGASLREIYARARAEFSAADLQKYTEIEEGVPMSQIIAEMESIQNEIVHKRGKKKA